MPSEVEKLRALLAEARECVVGRCDVGLRQRIDAALAEPVEPSESEYAMHARIRADYDKTVADSWRAHSAKLESERDEARAKLALLERHYSPEAAAKLRAELAVANAEIASLRWDRETACENTPTRGCECPGCGLARERAERGEA